MRSFKLTKKNILVIGDSMLDEYCYGSVSRISPEAPVPVLKKEKYRAVPGGAANVAVNISAAGQKVTLVSLVGKDEEGVRLEKLLKEIKVEPLFFKDNDRKTIIKTRYLADNMQQLLRVDTENVVLLKQSQADEIVDEIKKELIKYDFVVLSDYNKGFLSEYFVQLIIKEAKKIGIKTVVDVKDKNYKKYAGAYLLKPNRNELKYLTGMDTDTDEHIYEAAEWLREQTDCQYILTTCGSRGMILIGEQDRISVEAIKHEVFDVTGAGDTVLAYLTSALSNGIKILDALHIANYAASIQVGKVGTSPVFLKELNNFFSCDSGKIINVAAFEKIRDKQNNKRVVFTNGCFDIIHIGHIRYLKKAAELGDILVIGLNSDRSVRELKGLRRPINNEQDRGEVLASFDFVDYIIIFDETTPYNVIDKIRPDVLVKGGDYQVDEIVGKDIVEKYGGYVKTIPFIENKSTTGIINKIKNE